MMSLGVWFIGDLIGCIRMPRLDLPANDRIVLVRQWPR